jgi:hypothetical protein
LDIAKCKMQSVKYKACFARHRTHGYLWFICSFGMGFAFNLCVAAVVLESVCSGVMGGKNPCVVVQKNAGHRPYIG